MFKCKRKVVYYDTDGRRVALTDIMLYRGSKEYVGRIKYNRSLLKYVFLSDPPDKFSLILNIPVDKLVSTVHLPLQYIESRIKKNTVT